MIEKCGPEPDSHINAVLVERQVFITREGRWRGATVHCLACRETFAVNELEQPEEVVA